MSSIWAPRSRDDSDGAVLAWAIVGLSVVVGVVWAFASQAEGVGEVTLALGVGALAAAMCPVTWFLAWLVERVVTGSRRKSR